MVAFLLIGFVAGLAACTAPGAAGVILPTRAALLVFMSPPPTAA